MEVNVTTGNLFLFIACLKECFYVFIGKKLISSLLVVHFSTF